MNQPRHKPWRRLDSLNLVVAYVLLTAAFVTWLIAASIPGETPIGVQLTIIMIGTGVIAVGLWALEQREWPRILARLVAMSGYEVWVVSFIFDGDGIWLREVVILSGLVWLNYLVRRPKRALLVLLASSALICVASAVLVGNGALIPQLMFGLGHESWGLVVLNWMWLATASLLLTALVLAVAEHVPSTERSLQS